jgi:hypothetical protein
MGTTCVCPAPKIECNGVCQSQACSSAVPHRRSIDTPVPRSRMRILTDERCARGQRLCGGGGTRRRGVEDWECIDTRSTLDSCEHATSFPPNLTNVNTLTQVEDACTTTPWMIAPWMVLTARPSLVSRESNAEPVVAMFIAASMVGKSPHLRRNVSRTRPLLLPHLERPPCRAPIAGSLQESCFHCPLFFSFLSSWNIPAPSGTCARA